MKKLHTEWGGVLFVALSLVISCILVSCDDSIEDYYSKYCIFEPFEDNYAQVTFKTSEIIYPTVCSINGIDYVVAVINGFEKPEDALALTGTLVISDGIMAINSNAFLKAENLSSIILPPSCQSLGTNSLPPNVSEITLETEASKDLYRAIQNKDNLETISLTGTGITSIIGEFKNLKKVQVVSENANVQAYWPSLPSLPNSDALYFSGWYDSLGNKIISGTKIENSNEVITINSKQYYLQGIATPKFSNKPQETTGEDVTEFSEDVFNIPCFIVATEEKFSFVFTDYGKGVFGIKPNSIAGFNYELSLNSKSINLTVNESSEWTITLDNKGTYTFSCFYKEENTGEVLGYGQVSFIYMPE